MNFMLEYLNVSRELHSSLLNPVCSKYELTLAEILVLLFLDDNMSEDTAKAISERLKLRKSQISVSVRALEERGYISRSFLGHDRRTVHLHICPAAQQAINECRLIQQKFLAIAEKDFTEREKELFKGFLDRITANINAYFNSSDALPDSEVQYKISYRGGSSNINES